ncbi:MAG: UDP-glucose 4-epimerase GalE [Synergistaceae bacterium]|nr:UDP-glucose 4-epimerase GalE [Synergistaceae bacterium]
MSVLVCGGAGYIGSHQVRMLLDRGEDVVVLDDLRTGHREAVDPRATFHEGDVRDARLLDEILSSHAVDTVFHFCASSLVGESMERPIDYFANNVGGMISLLDAMVRHGTPRLVFSSSAAVYGEPASVPITEGTPLCPINPYGESKRIMEQMMRWAGEIHGVRWVAFRYFNVAGAWEDGSLGEDHRPETHVLPILLQTALGRRPSFSIYGDGHPTPDGTCVRDYVHVLDIADAHVLAMDHLRAGGEGGTFDLAYGHGCSVKELLRVAREVTGREIPARVAPPRPGDPAQLVASGEKARSVLGWTPRHDALRDIVATAWRWHSSHPEGYGDR